MFSTFVAQFPSLDVFRHINILGFSIFLADESIFCILLADQYDSSVMFMIWYSMQWSENRFIGVIIVLRVVKEIKILKAEIFLVGKH